LIQATVTDAVYVRGGRRPYFNGVKPKDALVALGMSFLCQPLFAFPVLGNVQDAKAFFRAQFSKWDAEQWLVLSQVF